ncbi:uncharacterized protein LOC111913184 [Lactuca sativa]|uniref:uncharacterized protein LOC111913184 n=1 Tax=Lactuca sativa TaxID=4236 RepID=UPI000CD9CBD1|nr:uncharacterized protein LOC111913184 [Lactuca sativa]
MASPDLPPPPANNKDDDKVPGRGSKPGNFPVTGSKCETGNGETARSAPPASGNNPEATNKRKRDTSDGIHDNKEKISTEVTRVVDTTDTVETAGVKEVEMKDAEAIDEPSDQGIKEVEMQDAEVMYNTTTHVEENGKAEGVADVHEESKLNPDVNDFSGKQDQGTKETEQPANESKSNEKESPHTDMSNGSGQQVLGEVATLLKQVQESDSKAKLEVEVKVKKMDHGVTKENGETEKANSAAQVSRP